MPKNKTSGAARDSVARPVRRTALGRDAWIQAARNSLIKQGIDSVQVGKLARQLRATRGGFYWFFDSRQQLLDVLLADWATGNTSAWDAVLLERGRNGVREFMDLVDMWVQEKQFDPQWDAAVREWARTVPKVAATVRRVDDHRIDILKRVFIDMGYDEERAFIRARVTYFHQVGYYTLGVKEPTRRRLALLPLYIEILAGTTAAAEWIASTHPDSLATTAEESR